MIEMPNSSDSITISPVWAFAETATYLGEVPVVICPIQTIGSFNEFVRYFLVFYKSNSTDIAARLILCRGVNAYSTNGKSFSPVDFSGIFVVLDLNGDYTTVAHILKDGMEVGEFDPSESEEEDGCVFCNVKPWYTVPSYDYYYIGNTIYIGNEPVHSGGGLPNIFTPIIPTPTGGGGGTGPNNNSLDFHFEHLYSNPMFVISEYLEENNLQGEAFAVFGYLNTTERQILANAQYLIDPVYEFLQENNNSTEARQFIQDYLPFIFGYVLTKNDLTALFSGFDDSPAQPINPPISTTKMACAALFNFNTETTATTPLSQNYDRAKVAALDNIYFQFNYQGTTVLKNIKCIGFVFEVPIGASINCLDDNCNNIAASIINTSVSLTQSAINNLPAGISEPDLNKRIKVILMSKLPSAVAVNSICNNLGYNLSAAVNGS